MDRMVAGATRGRKMRFGASGYARGTIWTLVIGKLEARDGGEDLANADEEVGGALPQYTHFHGGVVAIANLLVDPISLIVIAHANHLEAARIKHA